MRIKCIKREKQSINQQHTDGNLATCLKAKREKAGHADLDTH